jgi:hypothetical protein
LGSLGHRNMDGLTNEIELIVKFRYLITCVWLQIKKLKHKATKFTSLGMKLGYTPFHMGGRSDVITSPLKGVSVNVACAWFSICNSRA